MKTELIQALGRATEGQTIAWIDTSRGELAEAFQAADEAYDGPGTCRRTNGDQEITLPNGGRLRFLTPRRIRGSSIDRAYVPRNISDDDLMEVIPAMATSRDGAIVYH
jgi:hypothetical protein